MLTALILILYLVLIVFYVLLSFFIVYHLARYSINLEMRIVILSLFILVSAGLLFSNLALFFSIDWNGMLAEII
jgi:hypothetical protein